MKKLAILLMAVSLSFSILSCKEKSAISSGLLPAFLGENGRDFKLVYDHGVSFGTWNNIYVIWLENDSENFYYPIYICNRLVGKGAGPLTGTALPYWKINIYTKMSQQNIDAVTGATVRNHDFTVPINLPENAPSQFTVYFETDVSYNPNDWFTDQPAILYKADIDLENPQSEYILSFCGWTVNENISDGRYGSSFGVLQNELRYITNLNDGSGGFGELDDRSQTSLAGSVRVLTP